MPRYPWPAAALTPADMAMLHTVREKQHPKVPITELIRRAVRWAYDQPEFVAQATNPTQEAA